MKTSELQGAALDWAVAKAEKEQNLYWDNETLCFVDGFDEEFRPSICWAQGGPIIEREWIGLEAWNEDNPWRADKSGAFEHFGPTPLIAAMRCYVASKLGDEVEVPNELKGE